MSEFKPFKIRCFGCSARLAIRSQRQTNRTIACPRCGQELRIPSGARPAETSGRSHSRKRSQAPKKTKAGKLSPFAQWGIASVVLIVCTAAVIWYVKDDLPAQPESPGEAQTQVALSQEARPVVERDEQQKTVSSHQLPPGKHQLPPGKKVLEDLASLDSFSGAKNGFLIVTTNDLTHRLKTLQDFISHKNKVRGFRMFLATEDEFGAGTGWDKAHQIREWIKENHERLGLKFVMMIGTGHPEEGEVPMIKAGPARNHPTDYFYTDLSGEWDLNGDGFIAGPGDYDEGGIDCVPEVYVGRIPYYGETSDYGKAADTDAILARSIRYDNEKDIAWRYGFTQLQQWDMIPEEVFFERDVLEPLGINYYRDKCYQDTIGFPHYELHEHGTGMQHNVAKLHKLDLGYTRLGGHGAATGMHGINSGQTRQFLNDKRPTVVNMGACDVGHIEHQHNLAYTLLRYHAIATHGGTRSVTGFGGRYSKPYPVRLLEDKQSTGEAWWEHFRDRFEGGQISGTAFLINLYGDPSIVPFPTGLHLPYSFITKPVKPYHRVAKSHAAIVELPAHTLTLNNHNDSTQRATISTSEPWLEADQDSLSLAPGETKRVVFRVNPARTGTLSTGIHQAEMLLDDGNGYVCKRFFYLEVADARMVNHFAFDDPAGDFKDQLGSPAHWKVVNRDPNSKVLTDGVFGSALDMSRHTVHGGLTSPNQGHFAFDFWIRRDMLDVRAHILNMNLFLDVVANDASSIDVTLRDFDCWGKDKETATVASKKFPIAWQSGEWTHLALSFDQDKGELTVFQDAKKVDTLKTPSYLTFAPKGYAMHPFPGAIDELSVYNKPLSDEDLLQAYNQTFTVAPSPQNLARRVVPGDVELKFTSGQAVEVTGVYLKPKAAKDSEAVTIESSEDGKWIARDVLPETTYQWIVATKKGTQSLKGPAWEFTTSRNLIDNGNFEDAEHPWSGGRLSRNPNEVLKGEGSLFIPPGESITARASSPIEAGMGYSLKLIARTHWRKLMHIELLTRIDGKEVTLQKHSQHVYQDRHGNHVEFDFFAAEGQPYVGQPLFVRISNDPNEGSHAFIDNLTLMPYAHKSTNKAPEVLQDLDNFRPEWRTYDNNFVIRLNEFVADPEGQPLRFDKVSGPEWLRVRNGELMSNFGPSKDDLGENIITVEVTDAQNEKVKVDFTIRVIESQGDNFDLRRNIFGPDMIIHGNSLVLAGKNIKNWDRPDDYIEIPPVDLPAGKYQVILHYGCDAANAGSELVLSQGDRELSFTTTGRDRWSFQDHIVGGMSVGREPLTLKCNKKAGQWVMDLHSVSFKRIPQDEITLLAKEASLTSGLRMLGNYIIDFTDPKERITWSVSPPTSGNYRITLVAGSIRDNKASFAIADDELEFTIKNTGGYQRCQDHVAGQVPLEAGRDYTLTLKGTDFEEGLCDITHVRLIPVENQPPEFTSRPLHLASLKNNGESGQFDLRSIVHDEKPKSLRFKAVDVPDWVNVAESGIVEINPKSQALPLGKTLLKIAAVDEEGLQNVLFTRVAIHQAGVLTLPATDAKLSQGKQIRFTGDMITHIIQDDATAVWEFTPEVTGRYDVFLYAGSPDENTGKVTINDQTQEFAVKNTGAYRSVRKMNVGQFQLTAGKLTKLTLGVVKRVDGLCDVSHVRLVPIPDEQIQN